MSEQIKEQILERTDEEGTNENSVDSKDLIPITREGDVNHSTSWEDSMEALHSQIEVPAEENTTQTKPETVFTIPRKSPDTLSP